MGLAGDRIKQDVDILESEIAGHIASNTAKADQIEALILERDKALQDLAECQGEEIPPISAPIPPTLPPPSADITFNASNPYTAAKVSAAPAGTVFGFAPMTLPKAAIPTKKGNQYLASGVVILDGQNSTPLSFLDSKSTDWLVDGFEIKGYTGLNGEGEAGKEGSASLILRDRCVISHSHVHDNKYSGVRFDGIGSHIYDCELDNNHSEGFCGTSKGGSSIERSNIHHNGDAVGTTGLGNNRGGCKMVHTVGFQYLDNWVHHNYWNGLWSDINNIGAKYLRNVIEYNQGSGIFHEVSLGCEIASNTFRENGINRKISPNDTYPTKAQIEVSNSPDVWIHDNELFLLSGPLGFFGITALNSTHDQWSNGKISNGCLGVRNLTVENNDLTAAGPEWIALMALTGNLPSTRSSDQQCGQKSITDPASKNVFRNNPITKSGGAYSSNPYIFSGAHITEAAWAAKGYT